MINLQGVTDKSIFYSISLQAKRKPLTFRSAQHDNQLLWSPGPLLWQDENTIDKDDDQSQEYWDELLQHCHPIENFLELAGSANGCDSKSSFLADNYSEKVDKDDGDIGHNSDFSSQYLVPSSLVKRWGNAMGIPLH